MWAHVNDLKIYGNVYFVYRKSSVFYPMTSLFKLDKFLFSYIDQEQKHISNQIYLKETYTSMDNDLYVLKDLIK